MRSHLLILDEHEVRRPCERPVFVNNGSIGFLGEAHGGMDAIRIAPYFGASSTKGDYDLFERFPNGSSLWRGSVSGFESTRLRLQELAQESASQFYAVSLT